MPINCRIVLFNVKNIIINEKYIDNILNMGYTLFIRKFGGFMQTTVVKWGNSHGVRLPKVFLQNIKISENDPVDISIENEKIIIKKINQKNHKTIKQRLIDFYGENIEQYSTSPKEIDWGKPVGNEAW